MARSSRVSGEMTQFAEKVVNFSSQYGPDGSTNYVAANLAGDLRVYDRYGDFVEAFGLRTYGPWWQHCPSAPRRVKRGWETFRSQDFAELQYKEPVIPTHIDIYETYHPGAVVRILACNADPGKKSKPGEVEWVTLWSGPPQCSQIPKESRKFSPPLKKINFPTNLIRLEFNSEECDYYTELDGVALRGQRPTAFQKYKDRAEGFQVALTTRLICQLSLSDRQTSTDADDEEIEKWGLFGMLPDEIIQQILQYLDTASLSKVAQTCSLLLKNAYDPFLYSQLDLQSYWNTVDDVALESLMNRCQFIQHLDLSWTGGGGQITEQALCSFLKECGSELKTLKLACCRYTTKNTLATVGRVCKDLEELDLQSCLHLKEDALLHIGELQSLKRLNLYTMEISENLLDTIGRRCPLLEHLNIGASVMSSVYQFGLTDPLATALNKCLKNLKNLISLDLWRCRFVTPESMCTLADSCPNLEEVDIGWCQSVYSRDFDVEHFYKKCPNLKKIFLTCGRKVDDSHLTCIGKYCPHMEQLDILGTNNVTPDGALVVLKGCPKMFFFDLSFCSKLTEEVVDDFRHQFPHVCFKKSFSCPNSRRKLWMTSPDCVYNN